MLEVGHGAQLTALGSATQAPPVRPQPAKEGSGGWMGEQSQAGKAAFVEGRQGHSWKENSTS